MERELAMYLAGSIKKSNERSDESFWTERDMDLLKGYLSEFKLSFLNPAFRSDCLSDQQSVFGRDMLQVYSSDVVFVDARDRRGLGVGAEMMWAKFNGIPLIALAPKDTHYHKSHVNLLGVDVENWVHPFVESLCDHVVGSLEEGAQWIRQVMDDECIPIKGLESIHSAMHYYTQTQLPLDAPMLALIGVSPVLCERIDTIHLMLSQREAPSCCR